MGTPNTNHWTTYSDRSTFFSELKPQHVLYCTVFFDDDRFFLQKGHVNSTAVVERTGAGGVEWRSRHSLSFVCVSEKWLFIHFCSNPNPLLLSSGISLFCLMNYSPLSAKTQDSGQPPRRRRRIPSSNSFVEFLRRLARAVPGLSAAAAASPFPAPARFYPFSTLFFCSFSAFEGVRGRGRGAPLLLSQRRQDFILFLLFF